MDRFGAVGTPGGIRSSGTSFCVSVVDRPLKDKVGVWFLGVPGLATVITHKRNLYGLVITTRG